MGVLVVYKRRAAQPTLHSANGVWWLYCVHGYFIGSAKDRSSLNTKKVKMSAGETFSKIIVVTINLIFLLFGLAALIAGIVFKVNGWKDVSSIFDLPDADNLDIKTAGEALSLGAIIFGAFIVVLAIMGLIGGCCKVKCLLVFYAIIVIILLIAEIAIVIFVGVKAGDIEDETKKELSNQLHKASYNEEFSLKDKTPTKTWSLIFKTLKCCGVNDTEDFKTIDFYSSNRPGVYRDPSLPYATKYIPLTCCKSYDFDKNETLSINTTWDKYKDCLNGVDKSAYYSQGCVDKTVSVVTDNKWIFIGVGIAIFVIEFLAVILSFCLCCNSGKDNVV